jgi:hypothetical protein
MSHSRRGILRPARWDGSGCLKRADAFVDSALVHVNAPAEQMSAGEIGLEAQGLLQLVHGAGILAGGIVLNCQAQFGLRPRRNRF